MYRKYSPKIIPGHIALLCSLYKRQFYFISYIPHYYKGYGLISRKHVNLTHFLNCRTFNLPKVLMQTGKNQAPLWSRRGRITSSCQEVTVAGRFRCPHQPQPTTTRKRLLRRTHLATVVWTSQVRNAYFCHPLKMFVGLLNADRSRQKYTKHIKVNITTHP